MIKCKIHTIKDAKQDSFNEEEPKSSGDTPEGPEEINKESKNSKQTSSGDTDDKEGTEEKEAEVEQQDKCSPAQPCGNKQYKR